MISTIRAELVKLTRRQFVIITVLATAAFAVGSSALAVIAAEPGGQRAADNPFSVEVLSTAGGGSAAAIGAVAFGAVFLFSVFIGSVANEFARGTFRTLLLQQPGRMRLLAGKFVSLVGFCAVMLAVAEVVGWVTARAIAPGQGIDTSQWLTADGLQAAVEDYGRLLLWLVGWAVLGTAVGVIARSVPVGVLAGLVWAGPIENVVADGWDPAERWFPGILLRSVLSPEQSAVSTGRALTTLAVYMAVAIGVTTLVVERRDVTS